MGYFFDALTQGYRDLRKCNRHGILSHRRGTAFAVVQSKSSVADNGDESIGIAVEEFNDDQWFARINLSKHQAIELRNFLNEFIGDEDE